MCMCLGSHVHVWWNTMDNVFHPLDNNVPKHRIAFILLNSQISFCDFKWRVLIYDHQKNRWCALLPCIVAKGFAQGVRTDYTLDFTGNSCIMYNSVCCWAGYMLIISIWEQKSVRWKFDYLLWFVPAQRIDYPWIQKNNRLLGCLLLGQFNMSTKTTVIKIIDIIPCEFQQIRHPKSSI